MGRMPTMRLRRSPRSQARWAARMNRRAPRRRGHWVRSAPSRWGTQMRGARSGWRRTHCAGRSRIGGSTCAHAAAEALAHLVGRLPAEGEPPFDPAPVADALAGAIADPSARVRAAVAWAFSTLGAKTAIAPPPNLLAALAPAGSADLRAEAMAILPNFGTRLDEAIPLLVEALSDRDPRLRYRAAGLLGGAGPAARAAVPGLMAILKEPVGPRPTATDPSPAGRSLVEDWPDRWDPACEAARALGRITPGTSAGVVHDVVAALEGNLTSDHMWRRNAAAEGLFLIGKDAAPAAPALVSALTESIATEGKGQWANSWAVRALGLAAPGTATEADAIAALTHGAGLVGAGDEGLRRRFPRPVRHAGVVRTFPAPCLARRPGSIRLGDGRFRGRAARERPHRGRSDRRLTCRGASGASPLHVLEEIDGRRFQPVDHLGALAFDGVDRARRDRAHVTGCGRRPNCWPARQASDRASGRSVSGGTSWRNRTAG